ncbi:MAG TPA: transposon DNA-invertase [Gammaproteobacteria bacterium]|nr:transposon DNA-invertase [Gammaproteobacteria bacterium]
MLIGYARTSKSDGSQVLDLQIDALKEVGVSEKNIYSDQVSGSQTERQGLETCLKALRKGDTLVVWKLDRLGRSLQHLIKTVEELSASAVGFKVITGQGANIDTNSPSGKFIFSIFASLAEFERELIRERTMAGLQSARARGRFGGRPTVLTKHQVRLMQSAMKDRETNVAEFCRELKISRQTLYRYVSPDGELRAVGKKVLGVN